MMDLRGAWNTVEGKSRLLSLFACSADSLEHIGAGDKLRGGILDFADSATGTGGHHAETDVGKAKMQRGVAQTQQPATSTTTAAAPTTTNATTAAPAAGAQPTTTAATNGQTGSAGTTY